MAVQTGTANGHTDLLNKLVAFLTTNGDLVAAGQQWTLLRNQSPDFMGNAQTKEVALRAPGLTGNDQFFANIVSYESDTLDYYNWSMRGAVGFLPSVGTANQPGTSLPQYLHLWNQPIPYWFVANGRRVIVVAKISTVYEVAYLGAYLPYATPSQVPYPLLVGGTSSQSTMRWSQSSNIHRAFFDPSMYASSVYYYDGSWIRPFNWDIQEQGDGSRQYQVCMGPYGGSGQQAEIASILRDNVDGSYTLLPITINTFYDNSNKNVMGELDGMFYVSGHNNASENIMNVGGVPHLVVQNVYRTTRKNYAAIRLQ